MKILCVVLLGFDALCSPNICFSQSLIGVVGGVNVASEHYDGFPPGETISPRLGLLAGGQFDHVINNFWTLGFQFLFDQKGAHAEQTTMFDVPLTSTADWIINYLEVPLRVKLSIPLGIVQPYFFGGPSIGILLSGKEKLHQEGMSQIWNGIGRDYALDTTATISDSLTRVELSLVAGLGLTVSLSSGDQLFVEASYAYGMTNIDNYFYDRANNRYIYSRDFRIVAGILFPLN